MIEKTHSFSTVRRAGAALLVLAILSSLARAEPPASPDKDDLPASATSLREKFQGQFDLGVALSGRLPDALTPEEQSLVLKQFGAITPENCMKMDAVQSEEGRFTFAEADALVEYAKANDLVIAGHCLLWARDDTTPAWFFRDGDKPAARELLLKRLRTHTHALVGRYRGQIKYWEVVNEVLDDGEPDLRPSQWETLIGPDFIAKAFEYAHEADPNAILIYNDYSIELPKKRAKLLRLLGELKRQGAPIHAVGIQGHWEIDVAPFREIEEALVEIEKLGLKVVISELDLGVVQRIEWFVPGGRSREELAKFDPYAQGCPPDVLERQAEQYAQLFRLFRQHDDTILRVTFWNLHDGRSWLNSFPWTRTEHPLLFDRQCNPKPAYHAVLAVE